MFFFSHAFTPHHHHRLWLNGIEFIVFPICFSLLFCWHGVNAFGVFGEHSNCLLFRRSGMEFILFDCLHYPMRGSIELEWKQHELETASMKILQPTLFFCAKNNEIPPINLIFYSARLYWIMLWISAHKMVFNLKCHRLHWHGWEVKTKRQLRLVSEAHSY